MTPRPAHQSAPTQTTARQRKRVVILISGGGSNMRAIVEASQDPNYGAEIVGVISNRPDAQGLAWAKSQQIASVCIDHTTFQTRDAFDAALHEHLLELAPDIIACAGFMRKMTPLLVQKWQGRMLNIHPSLLPLFKGLHTHQRALDAGMRIAGCTVHLVSEEVDGGPILGQAAVPVLPNDTADALASRVLKVEHRLYPKVLNLWAKGQIKLTPAGTVTYEADLSGDFELLNQFRSLTMPPIE